MQGTCLIGTVGRPACRCERTTAKKANRKRRPIAGMRHADEEIGEDGSKSTSWGSPIRASIQR